MIPEFGHFALILAICLSVVQSIFPLVGAARNNHAWMRLARSSAIGQSDSMDVSLSELW